MNELTIIYEMSLSDYHAGKFPLWLANIPGEQLLFEFVCDDQECIGARGPCSVRVWRKVLMAA